MLACNALKHQVDVIHLETSWVSDEHLLVDGHHLNEVGHEELARKLRVAVHYLIAGQ